MPSDPVLWILPAGATTLILLGIITMVIRAPVDRGSAHWLLFLMAGWQLGGLLTMGSDYPMWQEFGVAVSIASAALLPATGLLTVCHLTRRTVPARIRIAVFAIPAATTLLCLTYPWHELLWAHDPPGATDISGPWFRYAHAPAGLLLAALSLWMLGHAAMQRQGAARYHLLAFLVIIVAPYLASAAYVAGIDLGYRAPTALIIAVTAPAIAWLTLRHGVIITPALHHRMLFEQMEEGMLLLEPDDRVRELNPAASRMLGLEPQLAIGQPLAQLLPHEAGAIAGTDSGAVDLKVAGRELSGMISAVEVGGRATVLRLLVLRDVTARRAARRELIRHEELLRSLVENSSNAVLRLRQDIDAHGSLDYRVLIANPVAASLFSLPQSALIGQRLAEAVTLSTDSEARAPLTSLLGVIQLAAHGGRTAETELRWGDGVRSRWFRMIADPVGEDIGVVGIDISRQRQQHSELKSAALRDPLTGALNRRGFESAANEALGSLASGERGAVMFIDLDEFKQVNDELGHEIGDQLLVQVAERLRAEVRERDLIARLGGDEFVVLVHAADDSASARLRERIARTLGRSYTLGEATFAVTASIGLARFPNEGVTLETLLRAADRAMYMHKSGRQPRETPALSAADR